MQGPRFAIEYNWYITFGKEVEEECGFVSEMLEIISKV